MADEEIKANEPLYGGGGPSGGMEVRVAKVEAHIEHILADLRGLRRMSGTFASVWRRSKLGFITYQPETSL